MQRDGRWVRVVPMQARKALKGRPFKLDRHWQVELGWRQLRRRAGISRGVARGVGIATANWHAAVADGTRHSTAFVSSRS
jgi:hypothetical protein